MMIGSIPQKGILIALISIILMFAVCLARGQQVAEPVSNDLERSDDVLIGEALGLASFDRLDLDLTSFRPGKSFTTTLKIEGCAYDITLLPHSIRGSEFRVWSSDGRGALSEARVHSPKTFRGYIHGMPKSHIAASLIHGRLYAMIVMHPLDGVCWFVQPLTRNDSDIGPLSGADPSAHVIYSSWDTRMGPLWQDIPLSHPEKEPLTDHELEEATPFIPPQPGTFSKTEIAIDTDWEFYTYNNSSVVDTVDDIESIFNVVTLIYERDTAITWEITDIVVRTEEGVPYPTNLTHPGFLLDGFRFWWNKHHQSFNRDVAHLMAGRNFDGNVIGIGWDRAICDSIIDGYGYAISRSNFSNNFDYRVTVTAHEIGHNYGIAGHCDNESECYIMCSYMAQCDGIGLPNFSPWSVNLITGFAASVNCLDTVPDDAIALVEVDTGIGSGELTVDVTPPDRNNKTSGIVPFTRSYFDGSLVTLTAPPEYQLAWLKYRFDRWSLDDVLQPQREHDLELVTSAWEALKAEALYRQVRVMTIESANTQGVDITVTPSDLDGLSQAQTPFELVFFIDDQFTLEAPETKGPYHFQRWIVNDVKQPFGQNVVTATIPSFGVCQSTAVYKLVPDNAPPLPEGTKKSPETLSPSLY